MSASTGGMAAVIIDMQRRRRQEETERYAYVQEHLREIIEKGRDQYQWIVNTNVSGLPEHDPSFFERLFGSKAHYKSLKETPRSYLERVFGSFGLYGEGGLVVARKKGLSLDFDSSGPETSMEMRNVALFEPEVTDCRRISADLPVRTHNSGVVYTSFCAGDSRALQRISLPDSIVYR